MEVAEDDGDDGPDPAELRERAGANKEGTPISVRGAWQRRWKKGGGFF